MKTMDDLKEFLIAAFPDGHICLFGSRARGEASLVTDIDIAIESTSPVDRDISHVKYLIEESQIPYKLRNISHKVDIVNLSRAPYLKKIVKREGIRWH